MTSDDCERCLDRGTIQGYTRGMFTGVPCPECRPDAYDRHAGRAPGP